MKIPFYDVESIECFEEPEIDKECTVIKLKNGQWLYVKNEYCIHIIEDKEPFVLIEI
jgi:hypothetical protein